MLINCETDLSFYSVRQTFSMLFKGTIFYVRVCAMWDHKRPEPYKYKVIRKQGKICLDHSSQGFRVQYTPMVIRFFFAG